MPDLVTPLMTLGYETCSYAPADDNANQDSFQGQGQTEDPGPRPREGIAQSPLEEATSHRAH